MAAKDVGMDESVGLSSRFFRETLKVRHLRILVALDQLGQISKVARLLNVTQPAISKQISELQKELGSPIIRRKSGSIQFTPIGELLVRHAHDVLGRIQRAEFDMEAFRKGLSGHVRIGSAASLMPSIVPEAIRLMLRAAPSAQVTVGEGHFNQMLPALRSGEIDIMVTRVWKPMSIYGIEHMSLGFEPIVVVAGTGHPLASKREVTWDNALDWPWLRAASGSLAAEAIDKTLLEQGHRPLSGRIEATSILLTLQLLRDTDYLAALPAGLARHHVARGEIVILPLQFENVLSEACCFWLSNEVNESASETVTLFRDCLSRAAGQLFSSSLQ